jgi:hypothetical protein
VSWFVSLSAKRADEIQKLLHSYSDSLQARGYPNLCILFFTGSIVDASEFGTSDIYTASIVAARNNVPVLLFRDAQCTLCPKVEDFLVGLGAPYQTVMTPFSLQTFRYFSCN